MQDIKHPNIAALYYKECWLYILHTTYWLMVVMMGCGGCGEWGDFGRCGDSGGCGGRGGCGDHGGVGSCGGLCICLASFFKWKPHNDAYKTRLWQTDLQTDWLMDIVTYRAAIAAKNSIILRKKLGCERQILTTYWLYYLPILTDSTYLFQVLIVLL